MKSKARDKSVKAKEEIAYHVIVKNCLCNVLCKFLIKIEHTWRHEIKEQAPQLTLLYCGRTVRNSHRRYSIKKAVLKILQYPHEAAVLESLFKKVAGLKACNFIIPEYCKMFKTTFSKSICKQLLFDSFHSTELLHGPKGSRSKLYDGIMLQGPSHRSTFLFLSRHLLS